MTGIKTALGAHLLTLSLLVLSLFALSVHAQDASEAGLTYGVNLTGTLDKRNPRQVYYFDGERCEVVSISLRATSGNLDPVLMMLDNSGNVIASRDDTTGRRDAVEESVRIPRTDRYYVVVGRFGYGLGTTAGDYELKIERIGVSAMSGCMLRYDDSVQNIITNEQPKFFYSFKARRGDIINIDMKRGSGDLDPYLQVVDSSAFMIADNDDWLNTRNARIENLLIEKAGTYIIVASRYGQDIGDSAGTFVLSIEKAKNSGLGNSARAAVPIKPGEIVEDNLTDQQTAKYYTFDAKRNDIVTIRMDRAGGRLDAFLKLANAGLLDLATDDDSGDNKNALINEFLIPADGLYYIVATRYEGTDAAPTTGRFRLQLESEGNAFDGVPAGIQQLTYGTTVTGNIDDITPQVLYVFWGVEGDVITASLNRGDGDLDPVISIMNADQRPLVSDDDGGGDQNARIDRYKIPRTGIYYIRATRYSGTEGPTNTHGSFILVLAQIFD